MCGSPQFTLSILCLPSPRRQVRRNGRGPGRRSEAAVRGGHDAARVPGRAHVAQQVLRDEPRIFHARRGGVDEPRNDDLESVQENAAVAGNIVESQVDQKGDGHKCD